MSIPQEGKPGSGSVKLYYVAVGTLEAKLATLLDLLKAFESAAPLGLVVCCGARDSLDAVCSAALGMECTRVWCLHAEMSEREIDSTVQRFKAACADPDSIAQDGTLRCNGSGEEPAACDGPSIAVQQQASRRSSVAQGEQQQGQQQAGRKKLIELLVATDVCLKVVSRELLPLSPTLLISYDIPTRKDVYLRRSTCVLGSRAAAGGRQRIQVHFVVAGQLEEFRAMEVGFAERPLEEMPVHVTDILGS